MDRLHRKRGTLPLLLLLSKIKGRPIWRTFKGQYIQRLFLLVLTSLSMALFLSPTLRLTHPTYKVGDMIVKDVRADRDLLVVDHKATDKKREEAANRVLSVYDYDPSVSEDVEGIMRSAYSLIEQYEAADVQGVEGNIKGEVEKILGVLLSLQEYQTLQDRKVLQSTMALILPLMKRGVVSNRDLLLREEGITVRNIVTGEEEIRRDLSSFLDYRKAKEAIADALEGPQFRDIPAGLKGVILKVTHNLIVPNLTLSSQETSRRKGEARNRIKSTLFQIKRGEILLEKGRRVTEEDIFKIETLHEGWHTVNTLLMIVGFILLTSFFIAVVYHFSTKNIRKVSSANKDLLFFAIVLITSLGMTKIFVLIAEVLADAFPRIPLSSYSYLVPVAAGAMLMRVVINSEVALIYSLFVSLFTGLIVQEGGVFVPIFYLTGSIIGAHSVARCDQRVQLIRGGLLVAMSNILVIAFQGMITDKVFEMKVIFDLLMGMAGGAVAGIIVVGLAPIVESVFSYTTDIKLLELTNLDQPILKEMLMKAPGTYHHSMIVGNMVEAGAKAIRVNPLLARVSAYYHDIGKTTKPQYFIENQRVADNPHDKLSPSMSSLILVSHLKDGIELAKRYKLGNKILDIIRQHHGTRLIHYFYQKAKEQENPEVQEADERDFRYLGPKPQTKEAGLVMLADAVEAASRTLDNPTSARIQGLVQNIINDIFIDGQLDECELTLKDLHEIGKSFNIILTAAYHQRIEYPEQPEEERKKNGGSDPRSTKEATRKTKRGKGNGRKDIKRLGVVRDRVEHPPGR